MDFARLESMAVDELREYVRFALWHYRVIDAFWFLYVAEDHTQPEAERLNERVWAKVSGMAAKDLVERFGIAERGLGGFVKALRLFPWTIIVGYQIDESPDEVIVSIACCPTQEARRRRGLGEYLCAEMHRREFAGFAEVIDPRIRIECEFAPPGERPAGQDCRWRFTVGPADESIGGPTGDVKAPPPAPA